LNKPVKRLIIVSNRLPILCHKDEKGNWLVEPSSGGLITALDPVFKNRGGMWIGWPGTTDVPVSELEGPLQAAQGLGYRFIPISLTREERDNFYLGFSNEIIWPLFHDLQGRCHFDPAFFRTYEAVNKKFAKVIRELLREDDLVWVQDYHLMGLARELRANRVKNKSTFFLHIPFPPLDIFLKLPWRSEILQSLLEFDVLGFQTVRDVRNFMQCVRALMVKKLGRRESTPGNVHRIHLGVREVSVGAFPISIDFEAFARGATQAKVNQLTKTLREDLPERQLIIGVDRLDYTKGIPFKLRAFETALQKFPELNRKITLIQNVVPSREDIHQYSELKNQIEQMVGEINGRYSQAGWIPIHYRFHSSERDEILAYYRMSNIAMVTPLKDGMNLVAKEYCAANVDEDGVLILSEFAGAAAELQKWALLVNPYDTEGMAEAIYRAFQMTKGERHRRMAKMRIQIKENNIFKWADTFLKAAIAEDLRAFPESQDFVPSINIA
jgi:trehalose 6-phosphate synthase